MKRKKRKPSEEPKSEPEPEPKLKEKKPKRRRQRNRKRKPKTSPPVSAPKPTSTTRSTTDFQQDQTQALLRLREGRQHVGRLTEETKQYIANVRRGHEREYAITERLEDIVIARAEGRGKQVRYLIHEYIRLFDPLNKSTSRVALTRAKGELGQATQYAATLGSAERAIQAAISALSR